jgi:mannose-6-phosphate isomerase-like protein (cupin superfamily)
LDTTPGIVTYDLDDLKFTATAALFEGKARAGIDITIFVVHTPPGKFVEMHVHPYSETFVLLRGRGRWTVGDEVAEHSPEQLIVVSADTPHGFRNVGEEPLLVVSVHESGILEQEFLGVEPS